MTAGLPTSRFLNSQEKQTPLIKTSCVDKIFQGGCVHSEKRIKPQDIPWEGKFLRKRLRQNTQGYRKNKKDYVANDIGKKTAWEAGEM